MASISDVACNRRALAVYVIDGIKVVNWSGGPMRKAIGVAAILAAAGMLPACSSMPTWTKPSVWYDQITSDPEAVKKAAAEDAAKASKPSEPEPDFPNLANTPSVPAAGLTASQQREVRESLAADRAATQAAVQSVKQVETPETRASAKAAGTQPAETP